jgi:MFS family permease
VQAVGLAGLGLAGLDTALAAVVVGLAVTGFGNGVAYSASTSLALADVPTADAGEASAVLSMLRLLGLTVGVAVSSMIVDTGTARARFGDAAGIDGALLVAAGVAVLGPVIVRVAPGRPRSR